MRPRTRRLVWRAVAATAALVAGAASTSCGAEPGPADSDGTVATTADASATTAVDAGSSDAHLDSATAEQLRAQIDDLARTLNGDAQHDRDAVYFHRQWKYNVDVQTCVQATGQEYPLVEVTYTPPADDRLGFDWWSELDPARAGLGFGYNVLTRRTEANPVGIPGYESMSSTEQREVEQVIARCGGTTGPSVDDPYPEATALAQDFMQAMYDVILSEAFVDLVEAPYRQCMDDAGLDVDWDSGLPDWIEGTISMSYYDAQIDPYQPGNEELKQQNREFEAKVVGAYIACRAPLLPQAMTLCQPALDAFLADHAADVDAIRDGWNERGDAARADMIELEASRSG
jgi:hypothetical protein